MDADDNDDFGNNNTAAVSTTTTIGVSGKEKLTGRLLLRDLDAVCEVRQRDGGKRERKRERESSLKRSILQFFL